MEQRHSGKCACGLLVVTDFGKLGMTSPSGWQIGQVLLSTLSMNLCSPY